MNPIVKFFHEMRNPHCIECDAELRNDPVVDELRREIESLRYDREKLLKYILDDSPTSRTDTTISVNKDEEIEPVNKGKTLPWSVIRAKLEAEDREKAQTDKLRKQSELDQEKAIQELESKLGVLDLDKGEVNVQSQSVKVNE